MAVNKVIYSGDALIDLTGDTVTADKLLAGYTAHDKSGALITGTLDPYKPEILITTNTTAVSMTVGNLSASPPAYLQPTYHEDTVWMYEVPSYGTWTVIASSMFGNITQQVVVDTVKIYRVDITATFDFSAASWSNIQYAAKNGLAADYWQVGDTRTYYDTGGTMHTVEIVDIGSNSMILDLVTPYYTGTIFTQTGPTSG